MRKRKIIPEVTGGRWNFEKFRLLNGAAVRLIERVKKQAAKNRNNNRCHPPFFAFVISHRVRRTIKYNNLPQSSDPIRSESDSSGKEYSLGRLVAEDFKCQRTDRPLRSGPHHPSFRKHLELNSESFFFFLCSTFELVFKVLSRATK